MGDSSLNKPSLSFQLLKAVGVIPDAPKIPKLKKPQTITPEQAAKAAALAADKKKKNALGAYGSEDTILTGPLGLTSGTPSANKGYKTLLGT